MKSTFAFLMLTASLIAPKANAASTFGLTTILTNSDCNVLTQVVGMLSIDGIQISSACQPGSYGTNDAGKYYNNAAITNLTVFDAPQMTRAIDLQSLVTAGDCEYLARSIKLLSTAQVTMNSKCTFGSFRGSDGRIYPARIDSSVMFNFLNNTLRSTSHPVARMMINRSKIGVVARKK